MAGGGVEGLEMAVEAAVQGVRQLLLLQGEKRDGSSAAAAQHCRVLQCSVQQLSKTLEQQRSKVGSVGSGNEAMQDLSKQLCSCFSTTSAVLALCKEVEASSHWLFEALSSHLAALFKSTFTLIKTSTELLDQLNIECLDRDTFKTVVSCLRSLCGPVLHFDPSLPVLVWRGVGRVVCRGRRVSGDEWSIQPIISDICTAMETKAVECVQCAPGETEGGGGGGGTGYLKLLKLCRFLSSLLVKLVQEFHSSSAEFAPDLASFLIHLYSCVPPSPHCKAVGSRTQSELESNILLVCEPVITALLESSEFLKCLLSPSGTEGCVFGWLISLCVLLKNFPKLSEGLQDFVMEPASSRESQACSCPLLDAVFMATTQCAVELQLPVRVPGVMCNGQPQQAVSLYEHLLTHLCCLLACLPHRHFPRVEAVLFRHLLSCADTHTTLLAADALTFLARCGEGLAECYSNLLAQLLLSSATEWSPARQAMCLMLLRRMVALLPPPHQALFTQAHPPSSPSHLPLWAHLHLAALSEPLQAQVVQQLAATSVEVITTQLQSQQPDFPSLHWALKCLHSSHSHHHSSTVTTAIQLWDWVVQQDHASKWGAVVLCDSVEVMSALLPLLSPQPLLKVFSSLRDIIARGTPLAVCLAAAHFLGHCGTLQVPSNLQTPVLCSLVCLFQRLLSHSSWLVLHHALLEFRHFAECTPYASAVEECIPPSLSDTVVDYLKSTPYLTTVRPTLGQPSFWVEELRQRREGLARWREGRGENGLGREQTNGNAQLDQDMMSCKIQLLVGTWHELCTQSLSPEACTQLHDLCTSIQAHISHHHPSPSSPSIHDQ